MTAIEHIKNNPIYKLDRIEKDLGMPQSSLSKAVKGQQKLSKKWSDKLDGYLSGKSFTASRLGS